jgi:hypothetical protein
MMNRHLLKAEFQPKLKNPRVVGVHRMKKRITRKTIYSASASGRIIRSGGAIAANHVVAGVAGVRWVIDSELRVVEDVEGLGAELEISLAENFEMFQEGNVEICASGVIERIAPAVSERQAAWSDVS